MSVPERLANLGKLYEERNKIYGDNFLHAGKFLLGLFPNGLTLRTEEDFNRFYLFLMVTHKIDRYAKCMERGTHHPDSCDDIAVYAQMLRFYDDLEDK